tara:strand:- start:7026 stop:8408 length:1383 start_codon:yes stop_codon:yes gene_type:complete
MYCFHFLLFYFISFSAYSQNQHSTFSGIILHSSDETPVDDVNIYFENTAIGTISNENGKFVLYYNSNKSYDYLIISKIGYATLRLKFSELQQNSPIYLSRESISLDEVVITQNKVTKTAGEIVEIAFQNLSKNISPSAYLSTGYIRHTERTKNEYRYLKEAIFTLYDPGFDARPNEINLNLNYSRNAIDNREIDTVRFYTTYLEASNQKSFKKNYNKALNYQKEQPSDLKKAIAFYDNHYTSGYHKEYGLLKKLFATDINKIRYYGRKKATFSKKNLDDFSFKIDTVLWSENDLTYKIKFSKRVAKDEMDIGYLFINKEDYAIVEVQYSQVLSKNHYYRKFSGEKIRSTSVIKYRKIDDYYYPIYMSYKKAKFNNKLLKSIREKNQKQLNYYSHQEILLSDIVTDNSIVEETQNKKNIWNDNLFQNGNYDDWVGKNFLLESSYEAKLREDLKAESLKKQM